MLQIWLNLEALISSKRLGLSDDFQKKYFPCLIRKVKVCLIGKTSLIFDLNDSDVFCQIIFVHRLTSPDIDSDIRSDGIGLLLNIVIKALVYSAHHTHVISSSSSSRSLY